MAPNLRASIEEQPPPYADDAHPLESLKEPDVEELPAYVPHPPLPSRGDPTKRSSRRRRWCLLLLAALIVIVAATVGGVLGARHHDNQQGGEEFIPEGPTVPIITALAAAECNAGTFVFYQGGINTSDIYLHGNFLNGDWNGTDSSETPPMKLNLTNPYLQPMYGANMTAVAYTDTDEARDEDIIVLRLYYIALGPNPLYFAIVEATLTLPMYPYTSDSAPSSINVTQQIIANVTTPSSIAACYIEDFGISLYYLAAPPGSGADYTTPATLTQLTMNLTAGPDPPFNAPVPWNAPLPLNATAFNSGAALAAACTPNPATAPNEIHLLFANQDNVLAQLSFTNNSWHTPSPLTDAATASPLLAYHIQNIAATLSPASPPVLSLYYLLNSRPQLFAVARAPDTGFNTLYTNVSFSLDLPDAVQAPALVAASTRVLGDAGASEQSLYYVWEYRSPPLWAQAGGTIANVTSGPQGDIEDSWTALGPY